MRNKIISRVATKIKALLVFLYQIEVLPEACTLFVILTFSAFINRGFDILTVFSPNLISDSCKKFVAREIPINSG